MSNGDKVGFIGLGAMGLPMAKNVIEVGGYDLVTTWHTRREPADELAELGAEVVKTNREVAEKSEVVITIVPSDKEIRDVVLSDQGLMDGFSEGNTLIDMTTATPIVIKEVAEELTSKGVNVIDAPVSGGTSGAREGTLTVIVGGNEEVYENHRSLLETMAGELFHVGPVGQGKNFKIINQLLAAIHLFSLGEAFALGMKSGADPEKLYNVLEKSAGHSRMMDLKLESYLFEGSFDPGFKLDLMKKDINLAVSSAQELDVPLFVGNLVSQFFTALSEKGQGENDHSAIAEYVANLSGTSFGVD